MVDLLKNTMKHEKRKAKKDPKHSHTQDRGRDSSSCWGWWICIHEKKEAKKQI